MYNGIGLLTARGSGTSGHVQSNSFNIRSHARNPEDNADDSRKPARIRKADDRILEHERKREIELKLIELAESLEDNGYSTAEIEREVQEMRVQMLQEYATMSETQKVDGLKKRDDTHALAKRKEIELERFKDAFGVRGDRAAEDAAPAQQTIEGPPKRLMLENGKPQVNDRFAVEEKALEEQLLREEEEEIAREREERLKRKAERQRRKDEKAAEKAAEVARIAAELAAREQEQRRAAEEQRHIEEERRRAEVEQQRWRDRERAHERGDRGGYSRDAYRDSRGAHESYRSEHEEYDRGHRGQRHRERGRGDERVHRESGYREREPGEAGGEDRYVEEVGTMGRHYEKRGAVDVEHGHKRRRVAEVEVHERHASRGRDREYARERGVRKEPRSRAPESEHDRHVAGGDWGHDEERWQGGGEDSREMLAEPTRGDKYKRSERVERSERSNGHRGNGIAAVRDDARERGRGEVEEGEEEEHVHEQHASRRYKVEHGRVREDGGIRGDPRREAVHEYERKDGQEGRLAGRRVRERPADREQGDREPVVYEGREVEKPRQEARNVTKDRHGGYRDEQTREEPPRSERRERSGYERDRRDERGYGRGQEEEGVRGDARVEHERQRSVPEERQRPEAAHAEGAGVGGRAEERARGNTRSRSVARVRSRSQSPANSDSLSFGTSSSDEA